MWERVSEGIVWERGNFILEFYCFLVILFFKKGFLMKKLLFGILFIMNIAYAELAEEHMATNWVDTSLLSQKECIQKAELAIKQSMNPSKKFVRSEYEVVGNDGNNIVMIRCISSKKIAFFIATGLNTDILNTIVINFRK